MRLTRDGRILWSPAAQAADEGLATALNVPEAERQRMRQERDRARQEEKDITKNWWKEVPLYAAQAAQAAPTMAPPASTWTERKKKAFEEQRAWEAEQRRHRGQQPPPPVPSLAPVGVIPVDIEPDAPALCSITRAIDLASYTCF